MQKSEFSTKKNWELRYFGNYCSKKGQKWLAKWKNVWQGGEYGWKGET